MNKNNGSDDAQIVDWQFEDGLDKFIKIADFSNAIIMVVQNGVYIYANRGASDILGYSKEELIGSDFFKFLHPDSVEIFKERYQARMNGENPPSRYDVKVLTKAGNTIHLDFNGNFIKLNGIPTIVGIGFDITKRKKIENKLKASEEQFRSFTEASPMAIMAFDGDNFVYANPVAIELSGYSMVELTKLKFVDIVRDDYIQMAIERASQRISGEDPIDKYELPLISKNGDEIWAEMAVSRFVMAGKNALLISAIDITDNKKLENQLIRSQKMSSVGTLAGGLAHDLSNTLAGVLGVVEVIKEHDSEGTLSKDKLNELLMMIERTTKQGSDIISQLLSFSKKGKIETAPTDINKVLEQVVSIAGASFDKLVRLKLEQCSKPAIINANVTQMEQAFLNVVINGIHAMTIMKDKNATPGGVLTISVSEILADKKMSTNYLGAAEGTIYWVISIKDEGVGMDQKQLNDIFDPFYTTKKEGLGTGLGLSMTYNIIKQHHGFFKVHSEMGEGTCFDIFLPKVNAIIDSKIERLDNDSSFDAIHGVGNILIIEDDDIMRVTTKEILNKCGYEVFDAIDGETGVALFQEEHLAIDGVLLDMNMSGLSDKELYQKIKIINPDVRVLLTSGSSDTEQVDSLIEDGADAFLKKPYTVRELSLGIKNLLG